MAPLEGYVKINVDAGNLVDHNPGTVTIICRGRDGSYLGSSVLVGNGLTVPSARTRGAVLQGGTLISTRFGEAEHTSGTRL